MPEGVPVRPESSAVMLVEPEVSEVRGTFRSQYSTPKAVRAMTATAPRLLDYLLSVVEHGDPDYFTNPKADEFAVVDVVTREKAWFEMPRADSTPDSITGMISSTFAASAFRVGPRVWFV